MPKKEITNEELALMIKEGFDGVEELTLMIKEGFDGVDKKFEEAARERKTLKRDVEEIKMKFAYCARQIDMEEMKKRVSAIEQKVGIKHQS